MTTPLDLVSGALRAIGALESGETPEPEAAALVGSGTVVPNV